MHPSIRILIAWAWIAVLCAGVLLAARGLGTDGWTPRPAQVSRPIVSTTASPAAANAAAARARP